jgi:hypothetical protein
MNEAGKVITPLVNGQTKPRMITVGKRTMTANGRWNNEAMADYIEQFGADEWITIGRLARDGCGANTIPNKKRVRSRLSQLFVTFMGRGQFLAVAYDGDYNSATAVKLADLSRLEDREKVEVKLERMRKHKELSEEKYCASRRLLRKKVEEAEHGRDEGQVGGHPL